MKPEAGQGGERKRCGSCAFADLLWHGTIECRRFPPAPYFEPTGKVSNIRPRVGQEYWCGEFQLRPVEMVDTGVIAQRLADAGARSASADQVRWRIIGALHEYSPGCIAEGTDLSGIADDVIASLTADGPIKIAPPSENTEP